AYVPLDALPTTPNNKVDRTRLPAPPASPTPGPTVGVAQDGEDPASDEQRPVLDIWRAVFGMEQIGPRDDFFELGGHSLLATRIVAAIRTRLGVELPVATVFEHPTVAALSAVVAAAPRSAGDEPVPLPRERRGGPFHLSGSQERMWFVQQLQPDGSAYNLCGAVRLTGSLAVGALESAVNQMIARHESLRTAFLTDDGTAQQLILPSVTVHIPVTDLTSRPAPDRRLALDDEMRGLGKAPFDLQRPPLFRLSLYRLADDEHVLFVCMHHIISDNWSFGVMSRELGAFYRAIVTGTPSGLLELEIQHVDFVQWHREWLAAGAASEQLAYWKQQLEGLPVTELLADRPRPPIQTDRGAALIVPIPSIVLEGIRRRSSERNASPFMVMLAAFDALLHRYTGADDIVVGVPIANRRWMRTEPLIGSFVNTLVLRVGLSGEPSFGELLDRVRSTVFDAMAHQDAPFDRVVEEIRPRRDLSRSPLFQL